MWGARRKLACRATAPVDQRALLVLHVLTLHMVKMAKRSTAGNLDPAFWHGDSREFEGEAARVALVCAVLGSTHRWRISAVRLCRASSVSVWADCQPST